LFVVCCLLFVGSYYFVFVAAILSLELPPLFLRVETE